MFKKSILALSALTAVAACGGSPDAATRLGEFNGTVLEVTWSPTSGKDATVVLSDRKKDRLPSSDVTNSPAFAAYFNRVTGCRVQAGQTVKTIWSSGKPFILIVPIDCS